MTSLILESKEQILKDKGLFFPQLLTGIWDQKCLTNPPYDNKNHGVDCKCCTPYTKESYTNPFKADRNKLRLRGRPKLRGGSEI